MCVHSECIGLTAYKYNLQMEIRSGKAAHGQGSHLTGAFSQGFLGSERAMEKVLDRRVFVMLTAVQHPDFVEDFPLFRLQAMC